MPEIATSVADLAAPWVHKPHARAARPAIGQAVNQAGTQRSGRGA
jgi:hypothetical protein